jgi:DNA-binding beta-propeller fold protein YncE
VADVEVDESEVIHDVRGPRLGGELWVATQRDNIEYIYDKHGNQIDSLTLTAAGPHITTFPPSSRFAYQTGMLDGKFYAIDAKTREVVTSIQVGPTLAHQAKPSPDGDVLLVSVLSTRTVVKIEADERNRTWTVTGSVSTSGLGKPPICTVFSKDGARAYVSLNPSGIAIVDVASMTLTGTIDTDGFIACGMIVQKDGHNVTVAASGSGGHIYNLDTRTSTLTDRGTLGAASWHSFITTDDGDFGFGTSPLSNEVILIDLEDTIAVNKGAISFGANTQPDALGGGERVGKTLPVSLRASGQLAFVDVKKAKRNKPDSVIEVQDVAAPGAFNPATCQDCAIHGVTVRPKCRSCKWGRWHCGKGDHDDDDDDDDDD